MKRIFEAVFVSSCPAWMAAVIALFISSAYVGIVYPLDFFRGAGQYFAEGDAAQHVSGWLFYARDTWHFPLLYTTRLNAPDGVSIALTDSIPLVALLLKPFASYLPKNFQYIGLWHAVAYLLQGLGAAALIRALGCRTLFAAGIAAAIAVIWPVLTHRLGHTSLMSHGLLLLALTAYFTGVRSPSKSKCAARWLIALIGVALLVHPYLMAMSYAIFIAYVLDKGFDGEGWRLQAFRFITSVAVLAALIYLLGYTGSTGGAGGFDYFSMNLASPFCGGLLLQCPFDATGGQLEGFNYWGAGGLMIVAAGALSSQGERRILSFRNTRPFLIITAVLLTLYALSSTWYLTDYKVLSYTVPGSFKFLTGTFRASGRFFWVVGYLVLFIALARLLKNRIRLVPIVVLVVALPLQWFDTAAIRNNVIAAVHRPDPIDPKPWSSILSGARNLIMYPAFGCGHVGPEQYLYFQKLAAHQGLTFNTGYIARLRTSCGVPSAGLPSEFGADTVFVMPERELRFIQFDLPAALISAARRGDCLFVEGVLTCRRDLGKFSQMAGARRLDGLIHESKVEYPANELPTVVGRREDGSVVTRENQSGVLSYGPYIDLAPGRYRFSIEYECASATATPCGKWDIVADGAKKQRRISNGVLQATEGTGSIIAEFSSEGHFPAVEIRSMYDGNGVLKIHKVTVERRY